MGSLSIWHWLIVLVIVSLVFGTKKLRTIGGDLGGAIKGFKEGVRDDAASAAAAAVAVPDAREMHASSSVEPASVPRGNRDA